MAGCVKNWLSNISSAPVNIQKLQQNQTRSLKIAQQFINCGTAFWLELVSAKSGYIILIRILKLLMNSQKLYSASNTQFRGLSFSRNTFEKLSPGPFLFAHLFPAEATSRVLRPCGRGLDETRSLTIHTGSLTYADGSAVVRLGNTAVVCGVRGEILHTANIPGFHPGDYGSQRPLGHQAIQDLGLFVPNIELATGCSPQHLSGGTPSAGAQSLAVRLLTLLHSSQVVSPEPLQIWHKPAPHPDLSDKDKDVEQDIEVKGFWTLYMDVFFISMDGNAFDASWTAILAALSVTKLPEARWDEDLESIVCDLDTSKASPLQLLGFPISCTYVIYSSFVPGSPVHGVEEETDGARRRKTWIMADPNAFEEETCGESLTIVLDCDLASEEESGSFNVIRVEKSGGSAINKTLMSNVAAQSAVRWRERHKIFRELSLT